ncbi:DUF1007 family protein [Rhizobium leguminosarum]|uniref:DUF1007 family protein n=1 Tax=Rhizobium leguminosarum TaxID=384 RepID=UPI001C980D1B|nr:DUF1007 family protein [Rhizobium leguminosarum]MBY5775019.1 DUF1007 family protein [Rhizobium leguminosarum]MBY5827681.1 DUF1007 family protein [Rhizobium leguminosarum]
MDWTTLVRRILLVATIVVPIQASAHPHHYVDQQVQLSIGLTAVELAVVIVPSRQDGAAIFSTIDGNGDGDVSEEEARTFGTNVVSATRLTIDGRTFTFALANVGIPDAKTVASGTAAIAVNASAELRLADREAHSVDFAITYEEFSHDWFVQPFFFPNLLGKISQLEIDRSDITGQVVVRFSNR